MKHLLIAVLFVSYSITGFCNTNADSADFYIQKANELAQSHKVWEADKNFQKAINFNPANDNNRIAYGNYLIEQRKFFSALEQYAKVLEVNINHVAALQKMTEVSFQLRKWNDVVMYGNKLLQNAAGNGVKYMVGKSFYELENYGQAQQFLINALAEEPGRVEGVKLLGKVYVEMDNYKQAIGLYNQSLQLDPNNNQLIYELGLLYFTMNDEKSAAKYFEEAADKGYKTDLDYYENLGLAYLGTDLEKGVQTLKKVLESKPGNGNLLFQIAQAYYKAEKYQQAADTYYMVFQNDAANSRALYMTGLAYQKKGDKDKGIQLCEKAIEMNPELAQLKTQKLAF